MSAQDAPHAAVAALGELARIEGYALAGVAVHAAETAEEALLQWAALPPGTVPVIAAGGAGATADFRAAAREAGRKYISVASEILGEAAA